MATLIANKILNTYISKIDRLKFVRPHVFKKWLSANVVKDHGCFQHYATNYCCIKQQGVALTGRNTNWPAVQCYKRRQTPATVTSLAPLHYV